MFSVWLRCVGLDPVTARASLRCCVDAADALGLFCSFSCSTGSLPPNPVCSTVRYAFKLLLGLRRNLLCWPTSRLARLPGADVGCLTAIARGFGCLGANSVPVAAGLGFGIARPGVALVWIAAAAAEAAQALATVRPQQRQLAVVAAASAFVAAEGALAFVIAAEAVLALVAVVAAASAELESVAAELAIAEVVAVAVAVAAGLANVAELASASACGPAIAVAAAVVAAVVEIAVAAAEQLLAGATTTPAAGFALVAVQAGAVEEAAAAELGLAPAATN